MMTAEIIRKFEAKMDELGYPTYKSMDNIYMDIRTRSLFQGYQMGYAEAVKDQEIDKAYATHNAQDTDSLNEIDDGYDERRMDIIGQNSNDGLHYGEL